MAERPLCFVMMPFGVKKDPAGGSDIDFDRIYQRAIRPAIETAEMKPIRADEERTGGIIHKPMFERLLLCDFAVADLTTSNANVFYELGVRHAVRPATTLPIFARHKKIPFDANFLRALPYQLGEGNRFGSEEAMSLENDLAQRLGELRKQAHNDLVSDSPLFQLFRDDYSAPDLTRLMADSFRDRAHHTETIKRQLSDARRLRSADAIACIENDLAELSTVDVSILIDLFVSYRTVEDWKGMIALHGRVPIHVRRVMYVRQQLAYAYNRSGNGDRAIEILRSLIDEYGPSSETCGLLARVYKDLWAESRRKGEILAASGYLRKAITVYLQGFETDWRDAYPGVNALTLLEIEGSDGSMARKDEILPVVTFAACQRLKTNPGEYWNHATLLELAVLYRDNEAACACLTEMITVPREPWQLKSTASNLALIRESWEGRGVLEPWLDQLIDAIQSDAER